MGVAANLIARILHRHRWIAYFGVAIIVYVALDMIWRGGLRSGRRRPPCGTVGKRGVACLALLADPGSGRRRIAALSGWQAGRTGG
jgi:predicted tellurium resistance membrane protein TerC